MTQKGGSSDFMSSFYAATALGGPAAISAATLQGINSAPMFNPLSAIATIPGLSTGIIPTGLYLASQLGGGMSVGELRSACNARGKSCRGPNGKYLPRATLVKMFKNNTKNLI